jgi:LPS export ABC transporter protein LptC
VNKYVPFNGLLSALQCGVLGCFLLTSCKTKEADAPVVYEGPLREAEDILMHYTENDRMKAILKAKKVFDFQNGDQEFPEGIYLEFFDKTGKLTSTLRANVAFYFKNENKWRGRGNVIVKNIEKKQQLNSEELYWMPGTKKIFTEKFVTITDERDVLYGTGLDAAEDMSIYAIKNPTGTMEVKEN